MRGVLSNLITETAHENSKFMMLSGDHGYALFDTLRKSRPEQFINVGVAEQAMVGIAAGLATVGYRPMVYGLAAFIPLRVLEQIKLDICFSKLPVVFLGDGAGLVYSTLGASHQCAEDMACLRALPYLRIYSPAHAAELEVCYREAMASNEPAYIRIGKCDRIFKEVPKTKSSAAYLLHSPTEGAAHSKEVALVGTGAILSPAFEIGKRLGLTVISVPRIKPMDREIENLVRPFKKLIVVDEHSRYGGLTSAILDHLSEFGMTIPKIKTLCLEQHFSELSGSYQFALSEHRLADAELAKRIEAEIS